MISVVILFLFVSGCSGKVPKYSNDLEKAFEETVAIKNMNTFLKVKPFETEDNQLTNSLHIQIENISNEAIFLSTDSKTPFVKIYIAEDNRWIEIQNQSSYLSITGGDGFTLPSRKSGLPSSFNSWVSPVIDDQIVHGRDLTSVRILIVGEWISKGERTGIPVGAYVDYVLK
jgi:hypothetical protein